MAAPKYRFIPFTYMADVAAQLATEKPTLIDGSLYRYRLPERSEEVRQIILKEVVRNPPTYVRTARSQTYKANDIKNWAKAAQKVVTDLEAPLSKSRFLRLEAPDNLWTNEGKTSLLVPLFDRTMQVSVRAFGSDEEARIDWGCGSILHLDERMGIRPLTGAIVFHLSVFQLAVTGGIMVEEEHDGNAEVSRTSETQQAM
jgi:hypothetical protein